MRSTVRQPWHAWASLGSTGVITFLIVAIFLNGAGIVPGSVAARAIGSSRTRPGVVRLIPPTPVSMVDPPATGPAPETDPPPTAVDPVPASGDRLAVVPPSADHAVMAPPSVSAALIDQVLTDYGSPAAGTGAIFYDLGVQYGIDPAYALAFFIHESSAGTKGVARFTNAIGNIRTTPGYRDYEGYRAYDTWAAGIEDWYKLIKDLYVEGWGKRTVAQIIPTYAPSADRNDPPSYIAHVTQLVDGWQR